MKYLDNEEYDKAIEDFDRSISLSETAEAYNGRGIAYYEKGEYIQSLGSFNMAIDLNSRDYKPFYNRGNAYMQLKYYNKAISDYEHALVRKPDDPDIYINKGNTHFYLKQFDKAIEEFNKAIKLDNKNYLTFFNKGKIQAILQKYDSAHTSLEKSIGLNADHPASLYWLGVCEIENGNKNGGCEYFRQATELGNPDAKKALSEICNENI